jgi:hypothetical protein
MKSVIKVSVFILLLLLASYAVPADAATTYHFGAAERQLRSTTTEVLDGAYCATDLRTVDPSLEAGNIKKDVHIFGVVGTYEGAGGTSYGLPKTGQQPGLPDGTPFHAGDDCSYATPESGLDVGYPRGTGSWANYNAARFTTSEPVAGQFVVTDNATGLMWEQKTAGGSGGLHDMNNSYTWADAFDTFIVGVNAENFAGHNDWRLPNCFELESILDLGRYFPSINPIFVNTQSDNYWSSTTRASSTDDAWLVYFGDGDVHTGNKTNSRYARAVRSGE